MNKKKEIRLPDNQYLDREEKLSEQYLHISPYTLLESIPEMLCEWWANTQKDMHTFLKDEGLNEVLDDETFTDILVGKYYFSDSFLPLLREKIPYHISLEKLYWQNKAFIKAHPQVEKLETDDNLVLGLLKEIYAQKREERKQRIRAFKQLHKQNAAEASARYRLSHKEKIRENKKKYRQEHKEEIKAYKASRHEKDSAQQHDRYYAHLEENRAKGRLYGKKRYQEHKAEILARQAKYRSEHRQEINERRRNLMKDEERYLKKREQDKAYYEKNFAEIQERRREKRLQNIEDAKFQERGYGKTYREKHRAEINQRNRARYQENLSENRKKSAERQKKYRIKKRFQSQTGEIIMPLLSALMDSKLNKDI